MPALNAASVRQPLRVLIVDDQQHTRLMLRIALGGSPDVDVVGEAPDGASGLEAVASLRPDTVLVDLDMPVLDGIGMLRELQKLPSPPRALVLTSNADQEHITRALDAGADGYVLKGCRADELRAAVLQVARGEAALAPRVARSVVDDYQRLLEERRRRDLAVIQTLANAVEARDEVTGNHCHNVARYGLALWREVTGAEPGDDLVYGFMLHDVGKISIPDAVLLKPGPLTPSERDVMRGHVECGVRLVEPLGFDPVVAEIISNHHEAVDGSGYPRGLRGEQIPLGARVFSVVDAFDAMTTDRPYRAGMPRQEALDELDRCSGRQFDAECVDAFVMLVAQGRV